MIPLTVAEIPRLLARPPPPGYAPHWLTWRRRHLARARWYHQRTTHDEHGVNVLVSYRMAEPFTSTDTPPEQAG